jgi:hypothetical protein
MIGLINPTPPEELAPAQAPQPFPPEWLNSLSEKDGKPSAMQEFYRRALDSGSEHVTWFVWRYQSKVMRTPLLPRQGSMFFLDCGRGPFAATAGHGFERFIKDRAQYRVRGSQIAFDAEERLIAWSKNLGLDIATFRVTPEEIAARRARKSCRASRRLGLRRRTRMKPCSSAAFLVASATQSGRTRWSSAFTVPCRA